GASIQAVFAPTTAGAATIELFAEDKFGVVGSASVQAPGAPSDPTGGTDVISENHLRWGNTGLVVTGETLRVHGQHTFNSITLQQSAVLSHTGATSTSSHVMDITVTGAVTVDVNSRIDVSGKGYLGGFSGDNANANALTQGNVLTAVPAGQLAGGSY